MTDNSPTDGADPLRDAWDAFADSLKVLGREALDSAPNDAERIDGLRFILRQLAYREEQFLEFPSGHKPEFFFAESPTRKVFADCPDTIYRQFSVTPGGVYRITGTRGASPYISFTAYRAGAVDRVVSDLHDGEITVEADGTFQLIVGGSAQPTNWLDLGSDAAFVIIREYTHDRVNGVKATFEVEQLEPDLTDRPELDVERVTGVLGLLGLGLSWVNAATVKLSEELRRRPNVMNEAGGRARLGDGRHAAQPLPTLLRAARTWHRPRTRARSPGMPVLECPPQQLVVGVAGVPRRPVGLCQRFPGHAPTRWHREDPRRSR